MWLQYLLLERQENTLRVERNEPLCYLKRLYILSSECVNGFNVVY